MSTWWLIRKLSPARISRSASIGPAVLCERRADRAHSTLFCYLKLWNDHLKWHQQWQRLISPPLEVRVWHRSVTDNFMCSWIMIWRWLITGRWNILGLIGDFENRGRWEEVEPYCVSLTACLDMALWFYKAQNNSRNAWALARFFCLKQRLTGFSCPTRYKWDQPITARCKKIQLHYFQLKPRLVPPRLWERVSLKWL